jgi:1-deoxy-D-xylulose-5-phosphate reductoisomerase
MLNLTILGSTGTIGVNTLDVVRRLEGQFKIFALTANTNFAALAEQCCIWKPNYAVLTDEAAADNLRKLIKDDAPETEVLFGIEGLSWVSSHDETDYVMAGIVGAAGLIPNLSAAKAGKRLLLANKESLVMSGKLLMDAVSTSKGELLPIDSEHNAIFQCLPKGPDGRVTSQGVDSILLTASGGPFRRTPARDLESVTPEQACAHPNWVMGKKISVDSATMMNKGLEIVEACWLFSTSPESIKVVVHPESIIHSMVQFVDGSVVAQLGQPDMRTPIAYSLAWPDRCESGVENLDMYSIAQLNFERPDYDRFPCLRLAGESFSQGGTAPTILNAANEIAVQGFLDRRLRFTQIPQLVEHALEKIPSVEVRSLDDVLEADKEARDVVNAQLKDSSLS